jgi:hypothetical protein
MPAVSISSSLNPECVVVLGWQASVSTPPSDTALRHKLEAAQEIERRRPTAAQVHRKHGAGKFALRIAYAHLLGVVKQRWVVHLRNARVLRQPLGDALRVLALLVHPQRHGG